MAASPCAKLPFPPATALAPPAGLVPPPKSCRLPGCSFPAARLRCVGEEAIRESSKAPARWASYGGRIPPILRALEAVADVGEALKPWEDTLSSKERSIILKEQPCWERALEIFTWFKSRRSHDLNVIHYNILLRALGRARRWDLLVCFWREMQQCRLTPTNPTYGTLIDVCSKGGMEKGALLWLADMYKRGLEPDEVTIGIVIQLHKKAGEFGAARRSFEIWSSSVQDDCFDRTGITLSQHTYNSLIDLYGKAGQLEHASEVFAEMLKRGVVPNTVTFNTMIHICGNQGHLEEMACLLDRMEELRCPPDTRTYNILISVYVKADDVAAAATCFSRMRSAGLVPDVVSYRTLLYAFSIRKMVGEAEMLVIEMEQQGLEMDEFTHSALTRMYLDAEMFEKSWLWFDKFQQRMSSECFAANIDAFGERGCLSLAEKAFGHCLARECLSTHVFNVMIKAYGLAKNPDKACEIFDSMEKYHLFPDKCAFSSIIHILCSAELPQKGLLYLREMQKAGFVDNCVFYCLVLSSFARSSKLKEAEGLFKEMIGFGVEPDIVVFGCLIDAFAEVGNLHETNRYVDLMTNAGFELNSIICNSLLKLYTRVGCLQEAQNTYQLLHSFEEGPGTFASNCMLDLYSEHVMVNEAEENFQHLRQRGKANEFSFSMMVNIYKKSGMFHKALALAQEMRAKVPPSVVSSYNSLIGLYTSDGRMKEASQLFLEMLHFGIPPNDSTFTLLGMGLIKRGASKKAIKHLELARREDAQSGLHMWKETIRSMMGA